MGSLRLSCLTVKTIHEMGYLPSTGVLVRFTTYDLSKHSGGIHVNEIFATNSCGDLGACPWGR